MRITESQLRRLVREMMGGDPYGHQEDAACPQCGAERRKSWKHSGYEQCDQCGYEFEDTVPDPPPTAAPPMMESRIRRTIRRVVK